MTQLQFKTSWLLLPLLITFLLAGCATPPPLVEPPSITPAPQVNQSTDNPTRPPTVSAAATPTRSAPNNFAAARGDYLINQRTRNPKIDFDAIIYRVSLTESALVVRFGMQNMSNDSRYLSASFKSTELRLVDSAGNEYRPLAVSDNIERFSLKDGYLPGQANIGEVTFPLPTAGGPFELHVPTFEPLIFTLDQRVTPNTLNVPSGEYPLDVVLYSSQSALSRLDLRLERVTVTADEISFAIAFVNTGRRPIGLGSGLSGNDSRVFDAEGVVYAPLRMSEQFRTAIIPSDGLLPGKSYRGEIVFPRPQDIDQLRFFYPFYSAATLSFNEQGFVRATVTSASGGPPPPTTTPTSAELALQTLEAVLNRQAQALMTSDLAGYLSTFAPELQPEQERIFQRSQQLPIAEYRLVLSPNTILLESAWERGTQDRMTVWLSYHWRGMPDNVFQHELRYWFTKQADRWIVSRYELDQPSLFWWTDDVQLSETDHFLIIHRPAMADQIDEIAAECEQVYTELQAAGFSLDQKYIIFVPIDQEDFRAQTGQGARTLGVAYWSYNLTDEYIQSQGRAFYLNGASLTEYANVDNSFGRKATIKHEMVHLVLARETMPFTPVWLIEGTAMYFADQYRPELRRYLIQEGQPDQIDLTKLTAADQLGQFDMLGKSVGPEYLFSAETVQYLINTYGIERFWEFYRSFTTIPTERLQQAIPLFTVLGSGLGPFRNEVTPEMLNAVYGLSLVELEAAVKANLQQ
ncbi:hypothetical protein [uncultured Chloroflexus sp.]|uniref:hypothetical protein n=1 Tax=uncultured Chloroflexus sp. TaxID=214040 RepID=UPI00260841BC|nr:hypothetical protein [uncultured Chloroflexus sp.]